MNNMDRRIKISIIMACILCAVTLCGSGLSHNDPVIDVETHPIYDAVDLDVLSKQLNDKYNETKAKYNGHDVVCICSVSKKEKNNKSMQVSRNETTVKVTGKKDIIVDLSEGNNIVVYGELKVGSEKKKDITISAASIKKTKETSLKDDYYFYDGNSYSSGEKVYLDENKTISFNVHDKWNAVEITKKKEDLLHKKLLKDSHCYFFNPTKAGESGECLVVLNFNYTSLLAYNSDKKERMGVERAIISNICPDENLSWNSFDHYTFFTNSFKTSYGTEFENYVALYKNYKVEFLFTPYNDGLCVLLYIYDDSNAALEDVLYVMRTLTISNTNN